MLVSANGGYDAWSKLNSANFACILPRSRYFSKRSAYSSSDLISPDCCLGAEREGVFKQNVYKTIRIRYRN